MPDIRTQIEQIVASAAQQIAVLVQQAAAEGVATSLAALSNGNAIAARRPSPRMKGAGTASRSGGRSKGAKRPQEELAKLSEKVASFIGKKPGLRIEQINRELGTTTKDLALPLRKLIADKVIATKGEKRATTYFSRSKKG